jgi:ferredoxin
MGDRPQENARRVGESYSNGYVIYLYGCAEKFMCHPNQSILSALAKLHNTKIASGCHGGGCGVCKVKVIEGEYETGPSSAAHITPTDRCTGVVLACRAYPRSDVQIKVIGPLPSTIARRYGFLVSPRNAADA